MPAQKRERATSAGAKPKQSSSKRFRRNTQKKWRRTYTKIRKVTGRMLAKPRSSLFDASLNWKLCLSALPSFGNYVPVNLKRLISMGTLASGTGAGSRMIVVAFHSCGIACTLIEQNLTFAHFTFPELVASPPTSVRCSRKTISVLNSTGEQAGGSVAVAHVAQTLPLEFPASGSISSAQWNELVALADSHEGSKLFSGQQLARPHKWSTTFSSAIAASEFVPYDPTITETVVNADYIRAPTTALIVLFKQPPVNQSFEVQISEQIACRFPAGNLLSSVMHTKTTVPTTAQKEAHVRSGAIPHAENDIMAGLVTS